jgi:hypothetical protein
VVEFISVFTECASRVATASLQVFIVAYACHGLGECYAHSPQVSRRGLTDCGCFALSNRLHDTDNTARLQGWLEPEGSILHIGHINAQAAILTQQYHGRPLLLIAGCVPNSNHVLDLKGRDRRGYFPEKEVVNQVASRQTGVQKSGKKKGI